MLSFDFKCARIEKKFDKREKNNKKPLSNFIK